MTDLERRALLGDRQAQEECTRQGIVLPCPFCGGKAALRSSVSQYGGSYNIRCENRCVVTCGHFRDPAYMWRTTSRDEALTTWNTRPAPPIGRCGECKHRSKDDPTVCNHPVTGLFDVLTPDDFCSYFEPKDGEEDAKS